jgi:hypothetical protein
MKLSQSLAALVASAQLGYAMDLDVSSPDSIRSAASTIAHGLMNYYQNNKTDTPEASIGTLPYPLYWWEAGAVWGGLIDYWAYTKDTSFNDVVMQAMMAQTGTGNDFLPEAYYSSMVRIVSHEEIPGQKTNVKFRATMTKPSGPLPPSQPLNTASPTLRRARLLGKRSP